MTRTPDPTSVRPAYAGDIGTERREVTFEPLPEQAPVKAPVEAPAPAPAPTKEPVPA